LDFSSVNNVDLTSIQNLIDVRNQLDRHATPDVVEWHFASVNNRWTKRALAAAGFGYPAVQTGEQFTRWKPIFNVAEIGGSSSAAQAAENEERRRQSHVGDIEHSPTPSGGKTSSRVAVVHGINLPLFHIDLTSALQAAISHVEKRE
jgi:sodium-independent sulfate anion transporter 11